MALRVRLGSFGTRDEAEDVNEATTTTSKDGNVVVAAALNQVVRYSETSAGHGWPACVGKRPMVGSLVPTQPGRAGRPRLPKAVGVAVQPQRGTPDARDGSGTLCSTVLVPTAYDSVALSSGL